MDSMEPKSIVSRRRALSVGVGAAGSLVAAGALGLGSRAGASPLAAPSVASPLSQSTTLLHQIEQIIGAQGMIANGLIHIGVERDDITSVTLHGVPILPAFEINGDLWFEPIGGGQVAMNSDLSLKASELDPFIDQLLIHDIVFQAEHQHFYDFEPLVWFIHFRAVGDPLKIARGVKAALNVTSTPFPQTMPVNPKTPLPAADLGRILGGSPTIGADGTVAIDVPRRNQMILGGRVVNPFLNIQTTTVFQPYGGGRNAAAAPDFGMRSGEIQAVIGIMRRQGWDIGCLYNQETDETPQLYFSHNFKTGDSIELAREIRRGLDLMDMKFM